MDGRERAVILGLYLAGVAAYLILVAIKYINGSLDFDSFKGEYLGAAGLLLALLIKLPPTTAEAKATANATNGTITETMNVDAENVEVKS